jgi:hypothetical protein
VEVELQQLQRAPAHAQQRRALCSEVHLRKRASALLRACPQQRNKARACMVPCPVLSTLTERAP